jgi:hypothetical protein
MNAPLNLDRLVKGRNHAVNYPYSSLIPDLQAGKIALSMFYLRAHVFI